MEYTIVRRISFSDWVLYQASSTGLGAGIRTPKTDHILPRISKNLHDVEA